MKWLMEQKTLAGFAVALTFLLLVGVPAWWSLQSVNETSARTTIAVVGCGSLLAITLVGLANGILRRDFQKRRQSEQERDRFFDLSLDMLCIAGTDGYFKRINPAFRQTLGWSDEELLTRPFFDFIHPDEHAAALRELQGLAAGKLTVQFRTRCRCHDGSWRWLSWNAVPQPDGLIYATGRDVTQLQDAEDALRASEEFNRSIVESGQDCLKVLSLEGRLLDMAAPGRRLMCVTDFEEIRDVDWFSFWNGEDHAAARRAVAAACAGETGRFRGFTPTLDGTPKWWDVVITPILGSDGNPERLLGVSRDMTQQHEAQEEIGRLNANLERRVQERTAALSESEERFRLLINATPDYAIFMLDPEGRIVTWNAGAESNKGYRAEEIIGQHFSCFYPPEDIERGKPEQQLAMVREQGQWEDEGWCVRKDGSRFWANVVISAVRDETGRLRGFSKITRDITERQRVLMQLKRGVDDLRQANATIEQERASLAQRVAERTTELRAANAELTQASRFKSEFLASMSHELRTPLNGVLGMNELLLRTELTDKQREYVEAGVFSGRILLQLINDVLDLSKIESGKLELDLHECDLEALAHDVIGMFSLGAQQHGLSLTCQLDPDVCVTALCDDTRVRQVLVNLIGNALKFTQSGGVTLDIKCTQRDRDRLVARFAITDTGAGIPEAKLNRLFAPFTQVDSSTTRQFGGTGLGLSICKQLVEWMGGTIGVESRLGIGSTFWFEVSFPLVAEQPATANRQQRLEPMKVLATDGRDDERHPVLSAHILVAEDNPINQMFVVELLQHRGCTCDVVDNGDEALVALQQHRYDLVLMDCQMPEMDGFTASREIRRREAADGATRHIPIIALTADALKGDRERCLDCGMDDYLSKPLQARQLLAMLENYSSIKNLRIDSQHDAELSRSAPMFPLPTGDLRELSTLRQRRTPIDVHSLTAKFSDNLALGITLLEEFAKTAHDRVEALANQVAQGNLDEIAALAHSLKGVVAMLAMRPLCEVLDNLESAVRDQDIETLRSLVPELRHEMQRVLDDIPTVRAMSQRTQAVDDPRVVK